jgi:hypothetical protein
METILATSDMPAGSAAAATVALVMAALCGAGLWRFHAALRGTTLVAAWCWAVAAVIAVATCEAALGLAAGSVATKTADSLRYAAACLSCCPIVAVLGAKRPQQHVWHLVVVSLWVLAVLPAAGALLSPGAPLEVDLARAWLLAALIALGCANWLFTRYWLVAILVMAGQTALLAEALPLGLSALGAVGVVMGLTLWAGAGLAVVLARSPRCDDRLDLLWRDFRDLYGAAWALRVAERINAAALQYSWPARLAWRGFQPLDDAPSDDARTKDESSREAVRSHLTSILRRFVSDRWIAARFDESIH